MSDIDSKVKQAETIAVSGWQKFVKGWLAFWVFVLKVIQEIVAPITDFQNHLDGYKIGGFLAFSGVAYLAFAAIGMADKGNIAGATVIGTFGTLLSGIGYFMFGHAKDVDKVSGISAYLFGFRIGAHSSQGGTDPFVTGPRRAERMKTVLTFASGASVAVTVADLETSFPGRVVPVPAVDGTPLTVGQSLSLAPGITLSVQADDAAPADEEVKKAEDTP